MQVFFYNNTIILLSTKMLGLFIPLPKIRQLNKHFFLFMQPFETSLQGCSPTRIGAGAAHYKTLSNPLSRAAEPAHRPWDANKYAPA